MHKLIISVLLLGVLFSQPSVAAVHHNNAATIPEVSIQSPKQKLNWKERFLLRKLNKKVKKAESYARQEGDKKMEHLF